jgi:hypothetical protein
LICGTEKSSSERLEVRMISLGALDRARGIAAVLLASLLASGTAAAAEPESEYDERERQLLDQIEAIEARNGRHSAEMLDALRGLILLYREHERHSLSLAALASALQVVRVSQGLYSLDQVPLLFQQIYVEEARGNDPEVWRLEQELLALVRRHPDDLRTVPALHEMADRQMAVLDRVLAGESHPNIALGCFYKLWPNNSGNCTSGSRKTAVQGMLAEAQRNYSAAITTLLRNEHHESDELQELEMKVIRGIYMVRSLYEDQHSRIGKPMPLVPSYVGTDSIEPWRSRMAPIVDLAGWELPYPNMGALDERETPETETRHVRIMDPYHRGRQSLRRLYAYAASSTPLTQAEIALQIADWDLLYSNNGLAVDRYELVYAMLEEAGVARASIEELFEPPTPVVLPAFEPNPLAADETKPANGYIDVAFEITRFGKSRGVEIRGENNATQAAKRDLVGLITQSRFRPRPTGGQFGGTSSVVVRYYLYDPT